MKPLQAVQADGAAATCCTGRDAHLRRGDLGLGRTHDQQTFHGPGFDPDHTGIDNDALIEREQAVA